MTNDNRIEPQRDDETLQEYVTRITDYYMACEPAAERERR
jgi:hypothetical protein